MAGYRGLYRGCCWSGCGCWWWCSPAGGSTASAAARQLASEAASPAAAAVRAPTELSGPSPCRQKGAQVQMLHTQASIEAVAMKLAGNLCPPQHATHELACRACERLPVKGSARAADSRRRAQLADLSAGSDAHVARSRWSAVIVRGRRPQEGAAQPAAPQGGRLVAGGCQRHQGWRGQGLRTGVKCRPATHPTTVHTLNSSH